MSEFQDMYKEAAKHKINIIKLITKAATEDKHDEFGFWIGSELNIAKYTELLIGHCGLIARLIGNKCKPDDFAVDRCYQIEDAIKQLAVDL